MNAEGTTRRHRQSGPRQKHVPRRTCVACRQNDAKRGLVRVVRTPEGQVEVDPSGRRNGRGAYLCPDVTCWDGALQTGILNRALKTTIDDDTVAALRRYADSLRPADSDAPAAMTGGN